MAVHGFFLLGERARNAAERDIVREVLVAKIGVDASVVSDSILYSNLLNTSYPTEVSLPGCDGVDSNSIKQLLTKTMSELQIANTPHMARMITLLLHCASNNEPALLVGPTGSGKTSACSLLAAIMKSELLSVNCHRHTESSDLVGGFRPGRRREENAPVFEWTDGPLVQAMKTGDVFLMDEINMADDAVVERLNAVLEPGRTLLLPEKGSDSNTVVGHANFRIFATMNPGGDFGKKELSPALRNRLTEIWIPSASALEDFFPVVQSRITMNHDDVTNAQLRHAQEALRSFLIWMSKSRQNGSTFANSDFNQKNQYLSLRDVTTWSNFIQQATTKCGLHAMVAFAHGARLVFLDGMSVGANAIAGKELETELWSKVLAEVPEHLKETAKKATFESELTEIASDENGLRFGPFLLKSSTESKSWQRSQDSFCVVAPCTLRNSSRVVRAMAVDSRPILLEGPPGAGKTSLVCALARAASVQLSRINLSESTEMSDLIGGDIPAPVSGQFCFRKGELLRAIEGGFWVLLDEMNLASQSVLEGLNSLLDHRRSVFIPELVSEIVAHPDFRIFAAQNPAREGCGRRGLPQSFLNRFTKVAVEAPSDNDLIVIAAATHPRVSKHAITDVVRTLRLLKIHFENNSGGATTAEFGLRQVLRWCRLLDVHDGGDGLESGVRVQPDPELCFDVIVLQGLAKSADREAATSIFRSVFNRSKTVWPQTPSVRNVDDLHVRVGWPIVRKGSYLNFSSLGGFCQSLRASRTRCLQAMAIVVDAGWPCIVSGESGSISASVTVGTVESFAALSGQKLLKLKGGSFLDADDLLGGYTQQDIQGELCKLRLRVLSVYNKMLSSNVISQPLSPNTLQRSLHDLEASITRVVSAETSFEPNEHGQQLMKSFGNVLSDSIALLSAFGSGNSTFEELQTLAKEVELISFHVLKSTQKTPPTFSWERSELVHAIERGDWVVFEDADQCSPSVLDRLNPLLELSTRAPSYRNSSQRQPTREPVLLPEAPPNLDGSPAVISPHPNFRLFLVVGDANGQRLSRAIIDRSIKLKLVKETSASDEFRDALSGSKPNPLNCLLCKSKKVCDSSAIVTDERSRLVPKTDWEQVPELRAMLSSVCTGMADFLLLYEHSLRMRDMHLLYLIVRAESSNHDLKALDPISVFSSSCIAETFPQFGNRPKPGELKLGTPSNFSVSFKTYLLESLSQMFLLGCTSSTDFCKRKQLLRSLCGNLTTASINLVLPTGIENIQNRADFCLDPIYGLDSVCPSKLEHFRVTRGQFMQAICLRFDVLVISRFLQSWKDVNSENEIFSYERDATPFFGVSKRLSNVSGQKLRYEDPVTFLGSILYKVLLFLVHVAVNFRSEVIPNDLADWTFPEEATWLQVFKVAQELLDFSRVPCNCADRAAYGMVLLRQIHDAFSVLESNVKDCNLRVKLEDVAEFCGQRAKYELVRPALPIPRTESGFRMERDLMLLATQESSGQLGTGKLSVPKALVNLSTPISESDERVQRSILSLKSALQSTATDGDATGSVPDERIEFPLWKQIMSTSLEDIGLTLLTLLQENEVRIDVNGLVPVLRSYAEKSLLEFSVNPIAPLLTLVPIQRTSWVLSSNAPHVTQISELVNECSLSFFMVNNRKYGEDLRNRSEQYLFCQSVGTDTLANSLLSFHLTENPGPKSITSQDAVAAACTLISGHSLAGDEVPSRRLLRLRYLTNSLYSLGLLHSEVLREERLSEDERNVLPSLIVARSICEEVAGSRVLSMLHNYRQVQNCLRNANGLIKDAETLRKASHALFSLVTGFLWVVVGVIRVQKAFNIVECLYGIDPSNFAEAEANFFISQSDESAAVEFACNAASVLKFGGDDLETSIPMLRAVQQRKLMSKQALDRRSEIVHRPKDFPSFSVFVSAVTRIRELLSEQSLIWKLFDISLQGSFMSSTLNFVQQQLHESFLMLLEKSCGSLEIGGELSHFRDIGGTFARGLREVQHGVLLSLKGLSVAISETSQKRKMEMASLDDLLKFPRAAFSDGRDSLEIVNRLKSNRLQCDIQAKAVRFLFLHCNAFEARVLPAVKKCFSGLVADWKLAQLKEESEEAARNSLFVIRENARVEDMPGMSELRNLENEEEEDFALHFNVDIPEVDELVGIGHSQAGEISLSSKESKSSEANRSSVLDVSDFWKHHASCFLHSSEDGAGHEAKCENSFMLLLSALGGIANETTFADSDSGVSVASIVSCLLSSRVSGDDQKLHFNEKNRRSTYNFYKDHNSAEVSKMKAALRRLIIRIADVQRHFVDSDGKHPVLSVVTDAAERALKASDITLSLGPLVSVLENVLRKADEWERIFASKALSLAEEAKELSKLALRWRRIEVDSWPNLLTSREELARERAEKWFYYLYDGLIGSDDNPYDGEENLSTAISTMDQFLRSSPQGEYETRIEMLLSISAQLESSDLTSHRKFGCSISGLCQFYKQFLPRVQAAIRSAKDPLEKKMNDFARLSTWHGKESLGASTKMTKGVDKELEYFRLKARSEKVRRKLHKLCRDADVIFLVPVFNEIAKEIKRNGFAEMAIEASCNLASAAPANRNVQHSASTGDTISTVLSDEFEPICAEIPLGLGNLSLFDPSSRLSKMPTLCKRMKEIGSATVGSDCFAVKQAETSSTLLRNAIRSRALNLRQSSDAGIK